MNFMTKVIKKVTKKVKDALASKPAKEPKKKVVVPDVCTSCNGTGLERPNFTASPLCSVCNGDGIINN